MIDQILNFTFIEDLKWLGGILSLIFGALVVILLFKIQFVDKIVRNTSVFLQSIAFPKKHLNKTWQKVLSRLSKNDEANLRLALIEADNIFDDLLKQMRFLGESMADRLKYLTSAQISNIDEIWLAHKLRNNIVHNPGYPVVRSEIESGIRAFEKALKEMEFLD